MKERFGVALALINNEKLLNKTFIIFSSTLISYLMTLTLRQNFNTKFKYKKFKLI